MSDTVDAPLESVEKTPEDMVAETIAPMTMDYSKEPMPEIASNYMPLTQFYGIDNMTQEDQSKLQAVWEYYAKDAKQPSTVLNRIKQEHFTMVQPNIGESKLQQMYNYVRLLQDIDESKAMVKVFKDAR